MMELTEKDKKQLAAKGISENKVIGQIETFNEGIPFVHLKRAAVVGDGIYRFSKEEEKELAATYTKNSKQLDVLKFVPASGAASRMFKALFSFLDAYNPKEETLDAYIERTKDRDIKVFTDDLEKFPFYADVKSRLTVNGGSRGEEVYAFVKELLDENSLNYGFYPKGLLPFHQYGTDTVTPFQEHLKEGALYASSNGESQLHFTISEQHEAMFNFELNEVREKVSKDTNIDFHVDYSFQKSATDTIAVDINNEPFRNLDGSVLFRPGGHGALIENLNDQDADIIFIKNIDNVAVMRDAYAVAQSKKILAGVLLDKQQRAFAYIKELQNGTTDTLNHISQFLETKLNASLPEGYSSMSSKDQVNTLLIKLQRPIRICGMVKNEGEPGGGPFWIANAKGELSLQIIESAQIDMDNAEQVAILKNSTHFNPVDLVCGVRNHKGEKYNLLDFVNHKQGFITGKTKDGKELKALELPGLWNGAMAYWNTIFVEVPLVTFNPVKTVNDLLKSSHQG
ncbi:MAG: hypothetical protein ACJAWH_001531 [Maribacter sp.]|jgi:hypothetical protein